MRYSKNIEIGREIERETFKRLNLILHFSIEIVMDQATPYKIYKLVFCSKGP